jgi:hypothetical protein
MSQANFIHRSIYSYFLNISGLKKHSTLDKQNISVVSQSCPQRATEHGSFAGGGGLVTVNTRVGTRRRQEKMKFFLLLYSLSNITVHTIVNFVNE